LIGTIRLTFRVAAGEVGSRFLAALRDHRTILAARCGGCGLCACPARPVCPRCGASVDELVDVGPAGTLEAWTQLPDRGAFACVRLDGADTAMVHRLIGDRELWRPGARVAALFAAERHGHIEDVVGFEVVTDEAGNDPTGGQRP